MAELILVLLMSTLLAGNDACYELSTLTSSVEVEWANVKPYIYNSSAKKPTGLLYEFLEKIITPTKRISYKTNNAQKMIQDFKRQFTIQSSNNTENTTILMPVMVKTNVDNDPCTIKVYHSKGPAYIVKRNVLKPLTQLGRSFINGGQIIGLTLILTVISGVFMWILDRRKNPIDFPPSFIQGSWQGFWWAFVTMTTVGYGDTAPKSIPARLYSILWMLLGMVAFSVLTANFTSSLTHEIEEDLNLFGKTVAVLNGSLAKKAAVSEGAHYNVFNDVEAMIRSLTEVKDPSINGLLVDRHVALSNLEQFRDVKLDIGKTIDSDYYIGLTIRPPNNSTHICNAIKKCGNDLLCSEAFQLTTLKLISSSVSKAENERVSSSLFDDYDFLIILLALFGILITGGLIWEYFYYKPKVERINKVNNDIEMDSAEGNETDKAVLLKSEVEDLCEECRAKVEHIVKEEGKQRLQSLQTVVSPFDGFSIIGNQLSSIPGVSSIRRIGSELPYNVQNLARGKRPGKHTTQ